VDGSSTGTRVPWIWGQDSHDLEGLTHANGGGEQLTVKTTQMIQIRLDCPFDPDETRCAKTLRPATNSAGRFFFVWFLVKVA
jgi:hypothetical protein